MYRVIYFLFFTFFKIFHRIEIVGRQNVPKDGPLVIIGTHSSYYDPPVLAAGIYPRKICFMAKSELFKIPVFSFGIRRLGAFPVKREGMDKEALKTAIKLLNEQKVVGIFPEGTRTRSKEEKQVFNGATYLAAKTKSKMLPVGISGTQNIMPPGTKLPRFAKIVVNIGEPIKVKSDKRDELAAISAKIMNEAYKLKEVFD